VIDVNGAPTLFYHGRGGGNCIATSDDDMIAWTKHPNNPVIPNPEPGTTIWRAWDPCAWKEGDTWYSLSGGNIGGKDPAFLFQSKDFIHWQYMHPLYEPGHEADCSVPSFFPLGGKYMLTFASHPLGAQYYIGTYADHKFYPEKHGRFTYDQCNLECGNLYAPIVMKDAQGRHILFGWVTDGLSESAQRRMGWSGVMCLPRVLSLGDNSMLVIEPAPELRRLRRNHRLEKEIHIRAESTVLLGGIEGDCLELALEIESASAEEFGLSVRRSPDEQEQTLIYYSRSGEYLCLDPTSASLNPEMVGRGVQRAPLRLGADEPLRLRVFLDHSILEVYANGSQCLTKRIYPSRPNSQGIALFARGGDTTIRSLDVWQMATIWPQVYLEK
jgi:sucrose-6-phosphate hydrolase SacC (GH32 family)